MNVPGEDVVQDAIHRLQCVDEEDSPPWVADATSYAIEALLDMVRILERRVVALEKSRT